MSRRIAWLLALASAPGVAAAGPWTQGFGDVYLELKYIHWQADERFVGAGGQSFDAHGDLSDPGARVPLGTDTDGAELVHRTLALYVEYGLLDWLDLTLFLPIVFAEFTDDASGFETRGTGDPVVGLRAYAGGPVGFFSDVKIPVSEVPREAELPISEGQVDWTLGTDLGLVIPDDWGWAGLRLAYRVRFASTEDLPPERGGFREFDPGDEFLWLADLGFRPRLSWLVVRAQADGLHSQDGESRDEKDGLVFQTPRREVVALRGGLLVQPGWGLGLEAMAGYPVWGRGYPAGPTFQAGLSYGFELY